MGFSIKDGVLKKYVEEPGVTEVTVPEGVTETGDWAFDGCTSLTSIIIPEGVTKIGASAFWRCSSLTSVTIPESVTEIGRGAFLDCISLSSVTIPESVTEIGGGTFAGCSSLTSITIPSSITAIGDWAFQGCSSLTSITIPEGVTKIAVSAFRDCSSLTSVAIPKSVTRIGDSAFKGCTFLDDVTIPESVTTIGCKAFESCDSLPYIDYHGDFVYLIHSNDAYFDDEIEMQRTKNYGVRMDHEVKYPILWKRYAHNPEEPELLTYVKKNFSKMFPFAIEHDDIETVKFVCEQGTLLTSRNIEKMLTLALENDDCSPEIVTALAECCGIIAEKASLTQLHRLFDLANEHDLTELKMRIMHIKHERFPEDEQQENDFSLD